MAKQGTLLVVDDNRNILTSLQYLLDGFFERVLVLASPVTLAAVVRKEQPDVVLLDMNFSSGMNSGNEGLYWLREVKRLCPRVQVVLFTAYADVDLAVTGIKEGATDFVVKPWDNARLVKTLLEAYAKSRPATEGAPAGSRAEAPAAPVMYWGTSEAMRHLRTVVEKVAVTDANILITGENGTGKDLLAHEIHRLSARRKGPMVAVDMGAIPESLFESELFGHVKGSFTDARTDRVGRFEAANGGTLFLDEIANLPYYLQSKLLTAIQRRSFVRVGSNVLQPTDIRLVCATNRRLEEMVQRGEFREDLLYRINTIHLHLPALRERREDILPLAGRFLALYSARYGRPACRLSAQASQKLAGYAWSGNIRELQHCIEKAVILSDGDTLQAEVLQLGGAAGGTDKGMSAPVPASGQALPAVQTLDEMERELIVKAIDRSHGNLSQAAAALGITRQTLYNKMKRHDL